MADDDEINLDEGGAGAAPAKKGGLGGILPRPHLFPFNLVSFVFSLFAFLY